MTVRKIVQNGLRLDTVPARAYPYLAEPLLPGERQQFVVDPSMSANGIYRQLIARGLAGYVVEGLISRGYEEADVRFDAYDCWRPDQIITFHGATTSRVVPIQFQHRRAFLELCFDGAPEFLSVALIEQTRVNNPTEAQGLYDNHCLCGFLGTVFKQPGASYVDCSAPPKKGQGPEEASGWQVLRRPAVRRGYRPPPT